MAVDLSEKSSHFLDNTVRSQIVGFSKKNICPFLLGFYARHKKPFDSLIGIDYRKKKLIYALNLRMCLW